MRNLECELKDIYRKKKTVEEKHLDWVVDTIMTYSKGLSQLTGIDSSYFVHIMEQLDAIYFLDDDRELITDFDCYRTCSFQSNNKTGIFVNDCRREYQIDGLTREMVNICIQYFLDNDGCLKNRNLPIKNESRLYEGIVETVSQQTWNILNPEQESLGEKQFRYFMEVQIADTLIDTMKKTSFLNTIFVKPEMIVEKIEEIPYEETNLLDYLESQMRPLIPYHGDYEGSDIESVNLLNSFEAICDCGALLSLKSKKQEDMRSKVG